MPGSVDEDNSLAQLQQTLDADPTNPSNHYNLGLFLWKEGEAAEGEDAKRLKEKAAESFLASAKLNPNYADAFRSLGHFYEQVAGDRQRAAKCYQRAVTLNPDDAEAGEGLCNLLDKEGKEILEISSCKEASDKSPRAFWAFRRLGFLQVHQRKWSEAVPSLQHAIRGYPSCADLWEALGLAYQQLGMFMASVKSYGRAIELDKLRIFALIESGNVQLLLGAFRKGVEQFRLALQLVPEDLSAKFGLASGLLSWARECTSSGAFKWAATLLEEASEVAKSCTCLAGNLYCMWKLHGDIQIAYAKCLPWGEDYIVEKLNGEEFRTSILKWKHARVSAAYGAKRAYQRALHLSPWQPNIYTDISLCLDLICSLEDTSKPDPAVWQLQEKMALGGLKLEPSNKDYWVILGCVSSNYALKQHSLVRALQIDVSLAEAWAYLGKMYWELNEKLLARQALDRARSIEPSLAVPWAGMSVDNQAGASSVEDSFESCLRAVLILPIAEFQVGLGALATCSGQLLSPQMLGAIRQAVQRAPNYAESHNIEGLVCEARCDYISAVAAYRRARFTLTMASHFDSDVLRSHLADVSVNLARSLCKAGLGSDAAQECEDLNREGLLGTDELQIYAVALWKEGRYKEALSMARTLAGKVSSMEQASAAAAAALVCKLVYSISGKDASATLIQRIPPQLLDSTQMRFIASALNALQPAKKLELNFPLVVWPYEFSSEIHSIAALEKMTGTELNYHMRIDNAVKHLQRTLHMFPNSSLIRNHIGSLLLSSGDWIAPNKAIKCTALLHNESVRKALKSPHQIRGASIVACYASSCAIHKFSFPSCKPHFDRHGDAYHLNRWLHQEPWNQDSHYLLIVSLIQKAHEENYPLQLCTTLKRLIPATLSHKCYCGSPQTKICQYQKCVLLLCASEISLQLKDYTSAAEHAIDALRLPEVATDPFFSHLQLCRVYGYQGKASNLKTEFNYCLQKGTSSEFGWVMLKYVESRFKLENASDLIEARIRECIERKGRRSSVWAALFYFACAQCFVWDEDYVSAELALGQACAEAGSDGCLLLCHGAICMELARQQKDPQLISRAAYSLRKAQQISDMPLPIVSLLLAQAEASLGSKAKWERNLRLEWSSWPPEMRPAELYFQMHLLASKNAASGIAGQKQGVEFTQSPEQWLLHAVHMNPSCKRYWRVLVMLFYGL
ncbi:hypothetical protein LUZ63_018564 [Rhynchospora breviuscula]|uniref:Tetratricopeptide repeat protein SKI3 n=1 Tax=Rhynchospora breviuscula TaxID=2022672 RepID=A0A9Q0C4M3_9POAL|nr:hypothetical protein LUZ63_018564 [Rhynchospora breviuscula]